MSASSIASFRALVNREQQASHPDVRLALIRLAGESKERLSISAPESSDFFEILRQSLARLKGSANADLRIGCLLDCAGFFYVAGDIVKGALAARDGIALGRAVGNDVLTSKAYSYLGYLLADSGAVAQGIEAYVAAIELAKKAGDLERRAYAVVNLGVALFYSGQYEQALACLDFAERISIGLPARKSIHLAALSNKAMCFLHLNRIEEGIATAEQCLNESPVPESSTEILSKIIRECNYVHLLLEAGDSKSAARRLPIIRTFVAKLHTQKTNVMAAIAEGLLEIHRGDASKGIDLLQRARDEAGSVNSLMQDALAALVKGYELVGRPEMALETLQHLMNRLQASQRECALLHMGGVLEVSPASIGRASSLQALQHKEALLRVRIAEDRLAWAKIEMLERLAVTADVREEASGAHGYRVGRLSSALAEELGLDSEMCLMIDLAARLHDIGKMGVPDRILLTSEALKEAERHFMCKHTTMGAELLANSNVPQLRLAEEIALCHHEWWDGSGYPRGLRGKRIPLHARIVALADVFDALTHGRPYSEPWSMERALEEIHARCGTQFDPELTGRFIALVNRMRKEHRNLDEYLARAGRNSPFLQARRKIKKMLEQEREHERQANTPGNRTRH